MFGNHLRKPQCLLYIGFKKIIWNWTQENKCHLIVLYYKHEQVCVNIGNDLIWESNVKVIGVTIDRDLKLHVKLEI